MNALYIGLVTLNINIGTIRSVEEKRKSKANCLMEKELTTLNTLEDTTDISVLLKNDRVSLHVVALWLHIF